MKKKESLLKISQLQLTLGFQSLEKNYQNVFQKKIKQELMTYLNGLIDTKFFLIIINITIIYIYIFYFYRRGTEFTLDDNLSLNLDSHNSNNK